MLPANSKYIGVTTLGGHVSRAVDFQAKTGVYVVMGKRDSWGDDDLPPEPTPAKTVLDDPVVAKQATLQLVIPVSQALVTANPSWTVATAYGQKWRVITPQQAYELGCRWVLVSASFDYNEAPVSDGDSYLSAAAAVGNSTLSLQLAGGYAVNDQVQLGLAGPIVAVQDVVHNGNGDAIGITLKTLGDDPQTYELLEALPAGTYITNLTRPTAFTFRQIGLVSHATSSGLPGQTLVPYAMLEDTILEYYYNTTAIPREVNRRDGALLILTF